jgi:hypothetical protein
MRWLRRVWDQASAQGPIVVAALMLGASALISAVANVADERNEHANDQADREQIARLEFEQECRSGLAAVTQEAQARKLDGLALGLVALQREDAAALAEQIERIEQASVEERKALDDRAGAVETCNERADQAFAETP